VHVNVLSRLFRGKFIAQLQRAFERDRLEFHGRARDLRHPKAWEGYIETLRNKNWVVYAKPPFGGPLQVLKYLARYTHRVAIANRRLLSTDDGQVSFRWKDYANRDRQRIMSLDAVEFLHRFLLHVLPKGFMRVRYYGFLANRNRADKLQRIRFLLAQQPTISSEPCVSSAGEREDNDVVDANERCPACGKGRLRVIAPIPAQHVFFHGDWSFDSS
jgi:hypothetical protein